jgi:uncharacterized protein YndB with AHSA1/START domain
MFKKFLLVFLVLGGLAAALVSQRPADFSVRRSAEVRAPVEFVFAQVAELRAWERWSPWEDLDPAIRHTYDGPLRGVGARSTWAGNGQVGAGAMRIVDLDEGRRLILDVTITQPMPSQMRSELTFAPAAEATRVTWELSGQHDFLGKAFALTMDIDELLGDDLDKGLTQLATVAEGAARTAAQELAEAAARRIIEANELAEADAAVPEADSGQADAPLVP